MTLNSRRKAAVLFPQNIDTLFEAS